MDKAVAAAKAAKKAVGAEATATTEKAKAEEKAAK
jgi:hypothetical protein